MTSKTAEGLGTVHTHTHTHTHYTFMETKNMQI